MHYQDLVPTTIFTYLKLLVGLTVFIVGLNLFFMITTYYNISYIAKLVQDSARNHNFIPEHDYIAYTNLCKDLTKNELKSDSEVLSEFGEGIPGVNRIVTNLKIVCWDENGNGLSDIDMTKTIHDSSNILDYGSAGVDDFYIGKRGITNKRQAGEILYAGVAFEYHFIVPLLFWDFSIPVFEGGNNLEHMWTTNGKKEAYSLQHTKGRETIIKNQKNYKIDFKAGSDNLRHVFGIMAVPCEEYYPDLGTKTNYSIN